jgi:hypothetical protein
LSESYQSTAAASQSTVATAEEKLVKLLKAQCEGICPPSRPEVEEALDDGLGRLMLLEARLRESPPGNPAEDQGGSWQVKHQDLLMKVAGLRSAVQDLRAVMTPSDTPLAYGFVCAACV